MKFTFTSWLGLAWLLILIITSWLLPLWVQIEPYRPVGEPLLLPGDFAPLGTDSLGRDFFSRIIIGSRVTVSAGIAAAAITIISGLCLGLTASLAGGWTDRLIVGFTNAALAIPGLLFALLLSASLGPGFRTVIIAVGFGQAPGFTRLARAIFLQIKGEDYITAARSMGIPPARIALRHLLPNAINGVASFSALHFSWSILGITTLTFLGLSGDPSVPELGAMLESGRQYLSLSPHLSLMPGILISLTVLSVYWLSEALH